MEKESIYIKECKKRMQELKPILTLDGIESDIVSVHEEWTTLVKEIKSEIKKGNRASFKLWQELQTILEEKTDQASEQQAQGNVTKKIKEEMNDYIDLAIQALDSIDLIYQTAIKSNLNEWAKQINTIAENYIQKLDNAGIEEVKALGQFIDGTTMISIGTVPQEIEPSLQKYQVYAVSQRGFRFKNSGKLLREAKVITIY